MSKENKSEKMPIIPYSIIMILIGILFGFYLSLYLFNTGGHEIVTTDALDDVCRAVNSNYIFVDNYIGIEQSINCQKSIIEPIHTIRGKK